MDATKITDADLENLRGLNGLDQLVLANTSVSDRAPAHLKGLPHLGCVGPERTKVTAVGVNNLQKALPEVTMHR